MKKDDISRESIKQKLGFDPMNPPASRTAPHEVDDNSPSIWAPLTTEERIFVYELRTGKKAPAELLSESGESFFYDKTKKHKKSDSFISCDAFIESCQEPVFLRYSFANRDFLPFQYPKGFEYCKSHIGFARRYLQSLGNEEPPKEMTIMWY